MVNALDLLETILESYHDITHLLPPQRLQYLWKCVYEIIQRTPEFPFLAVILHFCAVLIETTKEHSEFILPTLISLLPSVIECRNEDVRAECCRCYGWCCQVFPDVRL